MIPGNHDAYVADVVRAGAFEKLFGQFQTADVAGAAAGSASATGDGRARYPFVRLRGPLALVGVNSCVATGDLGAWGEVGDRAARAARGAARRTPRSRAAIRVVLIHHPPVMHKGGEVRNLRDRDALAAVLARAGADIVLHGHDHRDERADLPGPGGRRSRSSAPDRRRTRAAPTAAPATTSTRSTTAASPLVTRAHDEATDRFKEVRRERLV